VTINDITTAVMILVRLGVIGRFIFCMVKLIGADEEAVKYKKRAKNAVLFWIIAESVWVLKDLVFHYYG
jgi:hypothetical protein